MQAEGLVRQRGGVLHRRGRQKDEQRLPLPEGATLVAERVCLLPAPPHPAAGLWREPEAEGEEVGIGVPGLHVEDASCCDTLDQTLAALVTPAKRDFGLLRR
jgi:hypothetical protein